MKQAIRHRIARYKQISANIQSIPNVIADTVEKNKDILLAANRDQMLLGRDADGEVLGPSYLQDPYFETAKQAEAYARMKYSQEESHRNRLWLLFQLYPDKDRNTPNLIVTGPFQDAMYITTNTASYTLGSSYIDSSNINEKYNNRVFGLAPKSKEYFWREYLRIALINALNNGL